MPISRIVTLNPLHEHLSWLRAMEYAPGTISLRGRYVRALEKWLSDHGETLLSPSRDALRAWIVSLSPKAVRTRASAISNVRAFYTWTASRDLTDGRAVAVLERPRLPALLPHPIPEVDLAIALADAPARIRSWLLLAAYAGLRCGEISRVHRSDVDLTHRLLRVHGKGRRERTVNLGRTLVDELADCRLPTSGWLHPALTSRGGVLSRPVAPNQVSNLGNRYLHETGTEHTMHSLRHYYGTSLYRATRDLLLVRDQMGHASVKTTEGYLGLVDDRAAAGADMISGILARGSDTTLPAVAG